MSKHLPVIGSSAATTAFCSARIDGPADLHLFIDGNGKVTSHNGTLLAPKPNALSLRNIDDCPGRTPTCSAACYVENLKAAQPALYAMYEHNAATLRTILQPGVHRELAPAWSLTLAEWITANAPGGFRWHVSGDVFSLEYARFIADVCRAAPGVKFWIYTRSFEYLAPLAAVSTLRGGNLALNLSADADNYQAARDASFEHGFAGSDLRICYLTVDGTIPESLFNDAVVFPDYNIRPRQFATLAESPWWQTLTPVQRRMVCPVDAHGKSEKNRCGGPTGCNRCLT